MPAIVTVLSFITLFLAIFTPAVVIIYKLQQMDELKAQQQRQLRRAAAESDSAWILNRHLMR